MIAALVAALVLLKPWVLIVPDQLEPFDDDDGLYRELVASLAEPVGDHPGCVCGGRA